MNISALQYHSDPQPGKISTIPTKPCKNAQDLSLAYTPGVAEPCLEIQANPEDAYRYTSKGNLVGVISNGTAVLGLGDIGALAGKPVMEGKGVLFKRFADIDVFDLEISEKDPEQLVETIARLEPTFGGINLEDIKAPECFYVETELQKRLQIPVFHDDQHGTAIVVAAALKNALKIANKRLDESKIVVSGAGAAALAISRLLLDLGAQKSLLFIFDSRGLIRAERNDLNEYKKFFAQDTVDQTLEESLHGADVFIGVSVADVLTTKMVQAMNITPIIFALANPNPEIHPEVAKQAVADVIMATGRSDYPNQVNNVLGFPYIFRGALDVRAKEINLEMKLAAVEALAALVHQPVTKDIVEAYGQTFQFGPDYIIPKPFDSRLLVEVSWAVARAAVETGVAQQVDFDLEAYKKRLEERAVHIRHQFE